MEKFLKYLFIGKIIFALSFLSSPTRIEADNTNQSTYNNIKLIIGSEIKDYNFYESNADEMKHSIFIDADIKPSFLPFYISLGLSYTYIYEEYIDENKITDYPYSNNNKNKNYDDIYITRFNLGISQIQNLNPFLKIKYGLGLTSLNYEAVRNRKLYIYNTYYPTRTTYRYSSYHHKQNISTFGPYAELGLSFLFTDYLALDTAFNYLFADDIYYEWNNLFKNLYHTRYKTKVYEAKGLSTKIGLSFYFNL